MAEDNWLNMVAPAQPASGGLTDEQRMAWMLWRIRDLEQQLVVALAAQPVRGSDGEARVDEGEHRFALRKAHGYAPGHYMCRCGLCARYHTADKRAWRCVECADAAIDAARATHQSTTPGEPHG